MEPKDHFQSVRLWSLKLQYCSVSRSYEFFSLSSWLYNAFSYPWLTFLDMVMFFILPLAFGTLVPFMIFGFTSSFVLDILSFMQGSLTWSPNCGPSNCSQGWSLLNSPWNRRAGSFHFNLLQYLTLLTTPSLQPSPTLACWYASSPGSLPTLQLFILCLFHVQLHLYLSLTFRLFFLSLSPSVMIHSAYSPCMNNPIAMSLALESGPSSWALFVFNCLLFHKDLKYSRLKFPTSIALLCMFVCHILWCVNWVGWPQTQFSKLVIILNFLLYFFIYLISFSFSHFLSLSFLLLSFLPGDLFPRLTHISYVCLKINSSIISFWKHPSHHPRLT